MIIKASKLLFFSLFLLILGCASTVKPEHTQNKKIINDILEDSVKTNQKIANKINSRELLKEQLLMDNIDNIDDYITTPLYTISANEIPAKEFFLNLFSNTGFGVTIYPDIKGNISTSLKNVTLPEIFKILEDIYQISIYKKGHNYIVKPFGLETEIFVIDRLNVKRTGQAVTEIAGVTQLTSEESSSDAPQSLGSVETISTTNFWENLTKAINAIVGISDVKKEVSKMVQVNPETGIIIVKAYPSDLNKVRVFLDKTQIIANRQVLIEAKILEVQLNKAYNFGIDWNVFGAQSTGITPVTAGAFGSVFTVDAHSGDNFTYVLQLLSTQGDVSVISSPRVSALNNEKAVIKVGVDQYFITDVSTTVTPVGQTTQSTNDVTFEPFFSGVALDVVPQVSANDFITLHIHPSISRVTTDEFSYTIDDTSSTVPLARSQVREADSIVRAKSGQVIIIGGLTERNAALNKSGLSPLEATEVTQKVNDLISSKDDASNNIELVILLRPVIASQKTWEKSLTSSNRIFNSYN